MTEAEWLQSGEPLEAMLPFLRQQGVARRKAGRRKLRGFALACCRRAEDLLTTKPAQRALAVLDRLVDGKASLAEQDQAFAMLLRERLSHPRVWSLVQRNRMRAIENARRALREALHERSYEAAVNSARFSGDGQLWLKTGLDYDEEIVQDIQRYLVAEEHYLKLRGLELKTQAALLREIFGNPFHPLPPIRLPPSVRGVAKSVYQSQDAGEYLILADALEESDCLEQHLDSSWLDPVTGLALPLQHLRQPEHPHVKGCHIVDWILGRN